MSAKRLRAADLDAWVRQLRAADLRVVGPVRAGDATMFAAVESAESLVLGEGLPRKSAKGAVFPQTEIILRGRTENGRVQVEDVENFAPPTVLLGVRPCDAAAMGVLDAVFDGDYQDKFYLERRASTTIITLGCEGLIDEACFCTSLGLGPDAREGADIFAVRDAAGDLILEAVTDKGAALIERAGDLLTDADPIPPAAAPSDGPHFDAEAIRAWLDGHFEDDLWREMSLRCVGCGTCTFLCPTCHCFDMADETRLGESVRRKSWDTCQAGLFTMHASGHNPRPDQSARFRQRIMHKFKYHVDKFDRTLCVGCGRCVRACPVGHSLLDYLVEIDRRAAEEVAR